MNDAPITPREYVIRRAQIHETRMAGERIQAWIMDKDLQERDAHITGDLKCACDNLVNSRAPVTSWLDLLSFHPLPDDKTSITTL